MTPVSANGMWIGDDEPIPLTTSIRVRRKDGKKTGYCRYDPESPDNPLIGCVWERLPDGMSFEDNVFIGHTGTIYMFDDHWRVKMLHQWNTFIDYR